MKGKSEKPSWFQTSRWMYRPNIHHPTGSGTQTYFMMFDNSCIPWPYGDFRLLFVRFCGNVYHWKMYQRSTLDLYRVSTRTLLVRSKLMMNCHQNCLLHVALCPLLFNFDFRDPFWDSTFIVTFQRLIYQGIYLLI